MATEASGTQAIDRAAQLLVRVVESAEAPSIGELSERAGLPKSTTSRLVSALERQGLVQRLGERGRLRPGPVLLRYAHRDASQTLVELAAPALRRLADASGETINLAVPGPDGVEHLAQEDTAHFVGVADWVGRRVPFELAANGKCFLAFGGAELRAAGRDPRARLRDVDRRARGGPHRDRRPGVRSRTALRSQRCRFPVPRRGWTANDRRARAAPAGRSAHERSVTDNARCRMTHEEILKGLYDNTLVGNAPEVKDLVERRPRSRASSRSRCSTTRSSPRSRRSARASSAATSSSPRC